MEATLVRPRTPDVFIHSWTTREPQSNPISYIPTAYVKKAGRALRLTPTDLPGWKATRVRAGELPGGLDVMGDMPIAQIREIGVYALEFEDMLRRGIGGGAPAAPFRLKAFSRQEDFRKYATRIGAANALSLYDPRTREIAVYTEGISRENFQQLLAHEMTHAYMDLVWDCTSPLWFAEGMAEYFQHFSWEGDHCVGGQSAPAQVAMLRLISPIPLSEFVLLKREEMYGPHFAAYYAEAWAAVSFLYERRPEAILQLLKKQRVDVGGLKMDWNAHLLAIL